MLAALYPEDPHVTSGDLECRAEPENLLESRPAGERLVRAGKKLRDRYEQRLGAISHAWAKVRLVCTEADRFSVDFLAALIEEVQ